MYCLSGHLNFDKKSFYFEKVTMSHIMTGMPRSFERPRDRPQQKMPSEPASAVPGDEYRRAGYAIQHIRP